MTKLGDVALECDEAQDNDASERARADVVVEQLKALEPWLRSMEFEAERQRRVPQETIERLDATGVYALTVPPRFGGAEFSAMDKFRIYHALGRGCGAAAWTLWASAGGTRRAVDYPETVIRPIFEAPWIGNRTFAVGGTQRRHTGTARKVDGGWMIKGVWPFGTASIHASHGFLAVFLDDTDDSKLGEALVPKESYTLRHDWDVIGMAGTGSVTVVIEDELFVSDDHFAITGKRADRVARLKTKDTGHNLSHSDVVGSVVVGSGIAVGMAEHALELFLEGIGKKGIALSPYRKQRDAPVTHLTVACAKMKIRAAKAVAEEALNDIDHPASAGGIPSEETVMGYHAAAAYIWDSCAAVTETLFQASGASSLSRKAALQLVARNCRAGSMHAGLDIRTWMENYGRLLCTAGDHAKSPPAQ